MAVLLVGLATIVQVGAIIRAEQLSSMETVASGVSVPEQTTEPTVGGLYVAIIIIETIVIVLLWKYSSLLPDWVTRVGKYAVLGALGGVAGHLVGYTLIAAVTVGMFGIWKLTRRLEARWMIHNVVAVSLGITVAAAIGVALSPRVVVVFAALLLVWDIVAVWKSGWMDGLVGAMKMLPVYVILPSAWRVDLDELHEWLEQQEGPKPPGVFGVIGVGDLAVPAALSASAVVAFPGGVRSPAVWGVVGGVVVSMLVLRGSMERSESSMPALPWVNSGAIGGFVVGTILSSVSVIAVATDTIVSNGGVIPPL